MTCRLPSSHLRSAADALRSTGRRIALALLLSAASAATAQVGLARVDLGGVPVTLVYPTAAAASRQAYGPFELDVAADAEPLPGVRRLVVISHGTGGSPLPDHALAAALVRAGFVVAQPLHAGDNHQDASRGPESWVTRPQEVSRVIDALAAHPAWSGRLKLDRVGVHGHSAGGLTALTLAGARWRTLNLVRHCQQHLEDDLGFCLNGAADPAVQARRRDRELEVRPRLRRPPELGLDLRELARRLRHRRDVPRRARERQRLGRALARLGTPSRQRERGRVAPEHERPQRRVADGLRPRDRLRLELEGRRGLAAPPHRGEVEEGARLVLRLAGLDRALPRLLERREGLVRAAVRQPPSALSRKPRTQRTISSSRPSKK